MVKKKGGKSTHLLQQELRTLKRRLEETEETLSAIRAGEVDGLVISGPEGDQVFTLRGADHSYRLYVEAMNEGAVTLSSDGTILYCNDRFCDMTGLPDREIVGNNARQFFPIAIDPAQRRMETLLKQHDGEPVPVSISINPMEHDEAPGICMVVTDLSERVRKEGILRELSARLLTAQEEERRRISHEIHDALGSLLSGVRFMADNLLRQIGRNEDLEDMIGYISQACEETRRLQTALHPPLLDDLGIVATLSWVSREFRKAYPGISLENDIDVEEAAIPASINIVIYRIAQEALNNVAKHSGADRASLTLHKGDTIEFTVRDNGKGFAAEGAAASGHKNGIGLVSMRERTELSGGAFMIDSTPGKGTAIRASWDVRPAGI